MGQNSQKLKRLKMLLREALILLPSFKGEEEAQRVNELFKDVCDLIFPGDYYLELWDEASLNQIQEFFKVKVPNQKVYGEKLRTLFDQALFVKQANDLFFYILNNKFSLRDVCDKLSLFPSIDPSIYSKLLAADYLHDIRLNNSAVSEKIEGFLDRIISDIGVNLGEAENKLRKVIASIKTQESVGRVNALLVNNKNNVGTLVPLSVRLQPGKGEVQGLVHGDDHFKNAIQRAKYALTGNGFINQTDDIQYSLDITEANYSGDSIGLAAAVGMYATATKQFIDPYTAFTGNINLEGDQYQIVPIKGIISKLDAAILCGCRRIFLPRGNQHEIDESYKEKLEIIGSDNITEVLLKLHPTLEPLPEVTLQARKINCLIAYCQDNGWQLSLPDPIQGGLQLVVSPPHPPELKLNIYNSGSHAPKTHHAPAFEQLFTKLESLEQAKIPMQKVEKIFLLKDADLRKQIKDKLYALKPSESRQEQYCEYSYRFETGQEKVIVKQFTSGKLQLQGSAGELYKKILDVIIPLYNLKNPKAQLLISDYLKEETIDKFASKEKSLHIQKIDVQLPHIGTDESGKGDYFGPMVVAGVWIDDIIKNKLESAGVKDSKLLSDKRCKELAVQIRTICYGKFVEVELVPERYNELYDQFKKEGKNLNHLLAWGHARAIESLLEKQPCSHAIADQFGDEKYILSKLMEKGKGIELVQTPKGERYIAVAAASILARDRFLSRIEKLSHEYGMVLPKGASIAVIQPAESIVEKRGIGELKKVVKLHHKTTEKIVGKG